MLHGLLHFKFLFQYDTTFGENFYRLKRHLDRTSKCYSVIKARHRRCRRYKLEKRTKALSSQRKCRALERRLVAASVAGRAAGGGALGLQAAVSVRVVALGQRVDPAAVADDAAHRGTRHAEVALKASWDSNWLPPRARAGQLVEAVRGREGAGDTAADEPPGN